LGRFFSLKEKTMTHGKATNKAAPPSHPSPVAKSSTLILQHDWLKIPEPLVITRKFSEKMVVGF
jgi:hypothetical protein